LANSLTNVQESEEDPVIHSAKVREARLRLFNCTLLRSERAVAALRQPNLCRKSEWIFWGKKKKRKKSS
jgi:hypothetical protein